MPAPALWIGLGEYGATTIGTLQQRLGELKRPFLDDAVVRPRILWSAPGPGLPSAVPGELEQRALAALPQSTRKGNMRGPCYLFAVSHVDDLAGLPELADAGHWLWTLPGYLSFTGSRLVLLVSTDGVRNGLRDERARAAGSRLAVLDATVREAGALGDGVGQLITVQATAAGAGSLAPSMEAVRLLADLLDVVWDDPDSDSSFGQLLGIGVAQFPAPAPLTGDPVERATLTPEDISTSPSPAAEDGYRTFGIGSVRYDVDTAIRDLTEGVAGTLREAAREPASPEALGFGMTWRTDIDSVPLPKVPGGVPPLAWNARARFTESPVDHHVRVDTEAARLELEVPVWWRKQVESTQVDASETRAKAMTVLNRGAEEFERAVDRIWSDGRGLATARAYADHARAAIDLAMPRIPEERVQPPKVPSFTESIDRLRKAVENRPDPASSAMVLVLALGAALVAGFGIGTLLVDKFGISDPVIRGAVTIGSVLLLLVAAGAYPAVAWLLRPWQRIKRNERGVRNQVATAANSIGRYRAALAEFIRAEVQLEVLAQLSARVERTSTALMDFSRGLDDMLSAGEPGEVASAPGVLETWLAVPLPGSAAEQLTADFFQRYVPDGLLEDRSVQEPVAREFLRETIRGLVGDRVRAIVVSQPVGRETFGDEKPHALGAVGGAVDSEIHVFRSDRLAAPRMPVDAGLARVRADLSWPDRAFWLVSATTMPPVAGDTRPLS